MDGINLDPSQKNKPEPPINLPTTPTPRSVPPPPPFPSRPMAESPGFKPSAPPIPPAGLPSRPSMTSPPAMFSRPLMGETARPIEPPKPAAPAFQKPAASVPAMPTSPTAPAGIKITGLERVMEKSEPIPEIMKGIEVETEAPTVRRIRSVVWIIGALIVAGGLGVLAYFVIFPRIFPAQGPQPAIKSVVPVTKAPVSLRHVSYFVNPAAARSKITFQELTESNIREALSKVAASVLPAGSLKELEIAGAVGQIPVADYLSRLLGLTVSKSDLNRWFVEDFTAFMYYDRNGVWSGYVLKMKPETASEIASEFYPDIESSAGDLYISPASLGEWKLGNYKGSGSRYASGRRPGESFNYGAFGNFLILSTNFDGFKAAVAALGL